MDESARLEETIQSASPVVAKLPSAHQSRLVILVRSFLRDVEFRGAAGFQPPPEAHLKIAAHACLLLLNRDQDHFDLGLRVVLHLHGIHHCRELADRQFRRGRMDMDWAEIRRDGADFVAAMCRVMHEFAHRLDSPHMLANTSPALLSTECHATWAEVMEEERTFLRARIEYGVPTSLTPYAATNHAEFFACTTEAFFARPDMLRDQFPRVYAQLAHFYGGRA
jgi:Mlc titration factor MtfA (ptsG expression regulator)